MGDTTPSQETLDLLFELSRDRNDFLVERGEHLDTVAVGVIGFAALILGLFVGLGTRQPTASWLAP